MMSFEYLPEPDDDDNYDYDLVLSRCGMDRNGLCTLAGTEYCDWKCTIDWGGPEDEDIFDSQIKVESEDYEAGQKAIEVLNLLGLKYDLWRYAQTLGDIEHIRQILQTL